MKRLMVALVGVILVSGVFVAPGWAKGPDGAVGSVVAVRGEVRATGPQGERMLAIKSTLFESDTIRTGPAGRIQLLFEDDTIVSLGSNSVMVIATYEWDAGKQTGAMKTKIEEGSFRIVGGLITKNSPKNFTTETPAATIGIRGSMYAGSYLNDQLKVAFLGGRAIYVTNRHGRVEIDKPGYGTRVTPDTAPEPPAKMESVEVIMMVDGVQEEATGEPEEGEGTAAEGTVVVVGDEATTEEGGSELSPENAELLDPGTGGFIDTSAIEIVTNLGQEIVVTFSSDITASTVATAVASGSVSMTGQSQMFFRRASDGALVDYARRGVTATSKDGVVTVTLADGKVLPSFTMAAYNPTAAYTGWEFWVFDEPTTADTALGTIATTRDLAWDNKGEFFIYEQNYPGNLGLVGGEDYLYQSFNFGGVPTPLTSLPVTGVDHYWGEGFGGTVGPDVWDIYDAEMQDVEMAVNWANGKALGEFRDSFNIYDGYPEDHVYFYGDPKNGMKVITGESWSGMFEEPWSSVGVGDSGQFYGSEYQGYGFTASGTDYQLSTMSPVEQWQAAGAMFREAGMTTPSPVGSKTWTGYYVGLSDNITNPVSSTVWRNSPGLGGFSLTLDAASGSVSGTLVRYQAGYNVSLPFGGANLSAYVDDENFIAEFIPGTYTDMLASVQVQQPGSFLVTAPPEFQFSDYASWGYWNLVHDGTNHVHSPGSFWVAGQQTPTAAISNLVSTNFTGTYVGPAYGVRTDASNYKTPLTGGGTNLALNFGSGAINGAIAFNEGSLPVNGSASLSGASFNAFNAVTGASTSSLAGGFFGPNAETMAGTFQANMPSGDRYTGIFGGNR